MADEESATKLITAVLPPEQARQLGGLMQEWRRNGEEGTRLLRERAALETQITALANRQGAIQREALRLTCPNPVQDAIDAAERGAGDAT